MKLDLPFTLHAAVTRLCIGRGPFFDLTTAAEVLRFRNEVILSQGHNLPLTELSVRRMATISSPFDDQLVAVFAHDGVIAGKFKLSGNPDGLVPTILE